MHDDHPIVPVADASAVSSSTGWWFVSAAAMTFLRSSVCWKWVARIGSVLVVVVIALIVSSWAWWSRWWRSCCCCQPHWQHHCHRQPPWRPQRCRADEHATRCRPPTGTPCASGSAAAGTSCDRRTWCCPATPPWTGGSAFGGGGVEMTTAASCRCRCCGLLLLLVAVRPTMKLLRCPPACRRLCWSLCLCHLCRGAWTGGGTAGRVLSGIGAASCCCGRCLMLSMSMLLQDEWE
mmetsp:Transcript_4829/g.13932  ORF Transcript_4829/g.13932 Transcript_4829/m.13932 type:complete len:235 (-) Transcript_4829:46-750(-)